MAEISYFNVNTDVLYSDGAEVEQDILKYVQEYPEQEYCRILENDHRWPVFYHLSDVRENILNWYEFSPDSDVLEIGGGMGALTGLLCRRAKTVTTVELTNNRAQVIYARHRQQDNLNIIVGNFNDITFHQKFDYITLIGILEYAPGFIPGGDPADFLKKVRGLLKPGGKLLIAIENRFGLKYWCGANEDHTGKPYDGINGYQNADCVRTYSRSELIELLKSTGFEQQRFFYPLPDYKLPQVIYSDEYLPKSQIMAKVHYYYLNNPLILGDERKICNDLVQEGVFPSFANSFFIECGEQDAEMSTVAFVSETPERAPEYRVITVIGTDRIVRKSAALPQGQQHINDIIENQKLYKGHDLVPYRMVEDHLEMPFLEAQSLNQVLSDAIRRKDTEQIEKWVTTLCEHVKKSSSIESRNTEDVLRHGFLDLIFRNCFLVDGDFVFFDQEWLDVDVPMQYILFRAFLALYYDNPDLEAYIPQTLLREMFGISRDLQEKYLEMECIFLESVMLTGMNALTFFNIHQGIFDTELLQQTNGKKLFMREQQARIQELEAQNRKLTETAATQQTHIEQLEAQNHYYSESFNIISNAFFWKITKPARFTLDIMKWAARPHAEKGLVQKGLYSLRTNGPRVTWQKAMQKIYFGDSFAQVAKQALFTEEELAQQRKRES